MSYLRNLTSQNFEDTNNIYRNFEKYPEKINMHNHINISKKTDNSAILRNAINKRYKEDIKNNLVKPYKLYDLYNEEDNYDYNNYYNYNNTTSNKNYDNNLYYSNNYTNSNYIENRYSYKTSNSNSNYNSNSKYNTSSNNYVNEGNPKYKQALLNRINKKNRNKFVGNNYSYKRNKDDIYDKFIINYNSGFNNKSNKKRNFLNRNNTQNLPNTRNEINNRINRMSLNNINGNIYNGIDQSTYKSNVNINYNFRESYDYNPVYEQTDRNKIPYQKRKILDIHKNKRENSFKSNNDFLRGNKNIYYRNNDDTSENRIINQNYNTISVNDSNYDRNIYLKNNSSFNYYDNNKKNYTQFNQELIPSRARSDITESNLEYLRQVTIKRVEKFISHFAQYCRLYYYKIIIKLFQFLKEHKYENKKEINYIKINPKGKTIFNKNKGNIRNKKEEYRTNYHKYIYPKSGTEKKDNKTSNSNTIDIIIDRIKSNNESKSPYKKHKVEMYRNPNELSKKYENITNRRYRMSCNNSFKRGINDLSYISENKSVYKNSIEKNKEIWRNTLSKEREKRKQTSEKKLKNDKDNKLKSEKKNIKKKKNDINEDKKVLELIKKYDELKNKIRKLKERNNKRIIEDDSSRNIKNKEIEIKKKNNYSKRLLDNGIIIEKYKKKNLNKSKNKINDKYEMITVKNIVTNDKMIYINIKYLNYFPMKSKNIKMKNIKDENKLLEICDNFNIFLASIKENTGSKKNIDSKDDEKNNLYDKLPSIKEENKIDLDSVSQNSEDNN